MSVEDDEEILFNEEDDGGLYEYKCVNCLNIEHDLINAMKCKRRIY